MTRTAGHSASAATIASPPVTASPSGQPRSSAKCLPVARTINSANPISAGSASVCRRIRVPMTISPRQISSDASSYVVSSPSPNLNSRAPWFHSMFVGVMKCSGMSSITRPPHMRTKLIRER